MFSKHVLELFLFLFVFVILLLTLSAIKAEATKGKLKIVITKNKVSKLKKNTHTVQIVLITTVLPVGSNGLVVVWRAVGTSVGRTDSPRSVVRQLFFSFSVRKSNSKMVLCHIRATLRLGQLVASRSQQARHQCRFLSTSSFLLKGKRAGDGFEVVARWRIWIVPVF